MYLPDIDEAAVQDCNRRVTLEITKGKLAKGFAQTLDILIRIRLKGFGVEYRGGIKTQADYVLAAELVVMKYKTTLSHSHASR